MPHGFRNWCGETGQPREVAEASLAEVIKAKAAYACSDLRGRRREVMETWAECLADDAGNVVPFARRSGTNETAAG